MGANNGVELAVRPVFVRERTHSRAIAPPLAKIESYRIDSNRIKSTQIKTKSKINQNQIKNKSNQK